MKPLVTDLTDRGPALIAAVGERASYRFFVRAHRRGDRRAR
jgi:hypothetical protein